MPDELLETLRDANFDAWESVTSALSGAGGQVPPRVAWLLQHIHDTKRAYWQLIANATNTAPAPGDLDLPGLMRWELPALAALSGAQREVVAEYAGRALSVAALVRLNARHSVWHAGQIAALSRAKTA